MDELAKYYSDLLVIQYQNSPKAKAMVEAFAKEAMINDLPNEVMYAFDIETAEGEQLDILGKYQNVSRVISGKFGVIELEDEEFRIILKLAILRNSSGSSLYEIQNLIKEFFPDAIRVYDHKDMRLTYYVNTEILQSNNIANAFLSGGLLPFPMAVGGVIIYNDRLDNFFGYSTCQRQDFRNVGYSTCENFRADWVFLTCKYAEEIVIPEPVPPELSLLADENLIDNIVQEDGYYILV